MLTRLYPLCIEILSWLNSVEGEFFDRSDEILKSRNRCPWSTKIALLIFIKNLNHTIFVNMDAGKTFLFTLYFGNIQLL